MSQALFRDLTAVENRIHEEIEIKIGDILDLGHIVERINTH